MIHESEVKSFTKRFSSTIIGINIFGFLCTLILQGIGVLNNQLFFLILGISWLYGLLLVLVFYTRTRLKEYITKNLLDAPAFFSALYVMSLINNYKTYFDMVEIILIVVFWYFIEKREKSYLKETQGNTQLWLELIKVDVLDILGFRFPRREKS